MEEPTTASQHIVSEDPNNQFVIRMDDTEHTLTLERDQFVTDTTIKGESYEPGVGFTLPMLLFPLAESGSALLDLSFTSRIVMEIDDIQNVRLEDDGGDLHYEDDCAILYEQQETTSVGYQYDMILLEESDTNPVYIATESSMTEEIDGIGEIDIISDGSYSLQLENIHGSHDNGFLIYENGGFTLEAGTDSEGVIIFDGPTADDGDRSLLEDGVEDTIEVFQPSVAASVRPTVSTLNTGDSLNEGSFLTKGIENRTYGSVALSDLSSEFELTTEDGRSYVSEASVSSQPDNLISEAYDRGVVVTGTASHFEFDFNNLIVLEGTGTLGVINLESGTPEENSIILEGDDPDVFALLQQEDGSKIFTEEDIHTLIPAPERLCHVGLHDLILEEEGILQEETDQIKLEDFSLDNVTLEEFIIGQFVPYLGFGDEDDDSITIDDNMLLESATHKTENVCIVTEDSGHLIGQEEDETSHIVLDDFYFKYYSEGTITQTGTTITVSGGQFPSSVVDSGRFFYQNGVESTDIVSVSDSSLELTVSKSTTISSAENFNVGYALDDTPATVDAFIVMEAFTLDPTVEVVRPDIIFWLRIW